MDAIGKTTLELNARRKHLASEVGQIDVLLAHLRRPAHVDANVILANLAARETAKKSVESFSKRRLQRLDDILYLEMPINVSQSQ